MTNENDQGEDERDMRKIVLYDDEVLRLMQGWTGGETDPLYAISSTGGWNYAWVFSDAIANIDSDLSRVKKLGRDKFQLGKGTFTKAEIDELAQIRDALAYALEDPESVLVDEAHGVVRAPRGHHVADFNTLDDLIAHSGATHMDTDQHRVANKLYVPEGGGYRELRVWQKEGFWHAQAPERGKTVSRLPSSAAPIINRSPKNSSLWKRAKQTFGVRDYEAIDRRDRVIAGPFKHYGDAKDAAGPAGAVRFVPSRGKSSKATEARETRSAHTPSPTRRRARRR